MPKKSEEQIFQDHFRNNWPHYLTRIHPGLGSDTGVADLFIDLNGILTPCELKVGTIKDDILKPHVVRPSQIAWHRNLHDHGFDSIFVVGVRIGPDKSDWQPYAFDGKLRAQWKKGFRIGSEALLFDVMGC